MGLAPWKKGVDEGLSATFRQGKKQAICTPGRGTLTLDSPADRTVRKTPAAQPPRAWQASQQPGPAHPVISEQTSPHHLSHAGREMLFLRPREWLRESEARSLDSMHVSAQCSLPQSPAPSLALLPKRSRTPVSGLTSGKPRPGHCSCRLGRAGEASEAHTDIT